MSFENAVPVFTAFIRSLTFRWNDLCCLRSRVLLAFARQYPRLFSMLLVWAVLPKLVETMTHLGPPAEPPTAEPSPPFTPRFLICVTIADVRL